jgi:hypothetical protein
MKRFALILLVIVLAGSALTACASKGSDQNPAPSPTPGNKTAFEGQINEILNQLISQTIEKKNLADEELKNITCYEKPVDADSCQDILGLVPAEFASAIVSAVESKPEGSWFAHSVVLIECKEGTDVAALATQISKGTNPARFGCIKAEAVVVGYAGQHIILCASCQNTCDAVYATFSELSAVPSMRIDRANDWDGGGMLG